MHTSLKAPERRWQQKKLEAARVLRWASNLVIPVWADRFSSMAHPPFFTSPNQLRRFQWCFCWLENQDWAVTCLRYGTRDQTSGFFLDEASSSGKGIVSVLILLLVEYIRREQKTHLRVQRRQLHALTIRLWMQKWTNRTSSMALRNDDIVGSRSKSLYAKPCRCILPGEKVPDPWKGCKSKKWTWM